MTLFGDGILPEVTKSIRLLEGGRGQSGVTCVLVGKGCLDTDIHRGKDDGQREKTAVGKLESVRLVPKRGVGTNAPSVPQRTRSANLDLGRVWPPTAVIQGPYLQNMCVFVCMGMNAHVYVCACICVMCVCVSTGTIYFITTIIKINSS